MSPKTDVVGNVKLLPGPLIIEYPLFEVMVKLVFTKLQVSPNPPAFDEIVIDPDPFVIAIPAPAVSVPAIGVLPVLPMTTCPLRVGNTSGFCA
jgi:hypothetical protein